MPKLHEIIQILENFAPRNYQENYDNSGLLVGNADLEITKGILCLDCTEAIIDEAIAMHANLVIAHHPIIFSGLKSLTGKNYIERTVLKAIKNDIAIFAMHTNLDNVKQGVNHKICEKLNLSDLEILKPKNEQLFQLFTYVPNSHAEALKEALFEAGAGSIGNYSHCSFTLEGKGAYLPNQDAKPFLGSKGQIHEENEQKLEVVLPYFLKDKIQNTLLANHPYEEVAFGFISLHNEDSQIGSGMIGQLEKPLAKNDFLAFLKKKMQTDCIRFTQNAKNTIQKVAVCGGSGSFLLREAIQKGADAYISADFKYHEFFDAENKLMICDIGHYESEQFTMEIFIDILSKKIPNFAVQITSVNTNPIQYY